MLVKQWINVCYNNSDKTMFIIELAMVIFIYTIKGNIWGSYIYLYLLGFPGGSDGKVSAS